jgi:hypothetical protein
VCDGPVGYKGWSRKGVGNGLELRGRRHHGGYGRGGGVLWLVL